MRPIYLTGDRVSLRPMVPGDKEHTVVWYDTPFPVNSRFGERRLQEIHKSLWEAPARQFAIIRSTDDTVVGGAHVHFSTRDRKAWIRMHTAPLLEDADEVQAASLKILVPWLLDDHNLRRVDVTIPHEDEQTIRTAESLGMHQAVRLRQYLRRPGRRVDALIYQILNPSQEHFYAKSGTGQ